MDWYKIKTAEDTYIAGNISFVGGEVRRKYSIGLNGKNTFIYADGTNPIGFGRVCDVKDIVEMEWLSEAAVMELLSNNGYEFVDGIIRVKSSINWDKIKFGKSIYVMDTIYTDERDIEIIPISLEDGKFTYAAACNINSLCFGEYSTREIKSLTEI